MIMRAYSNDYLNDVVENQGKLFDFVERCKRLEKNDECCLFS